jgi:hypothetical protein
MDKGEYTHRQDQRGQRPTEIKATFLDWFVKEIAHRRAKWPREDERCPEQGHSADFGPEIECCEDGEASGKDDRRTHIPKSAGIRRPITKRSTEGLRKGDRDPILDFGFRAAHANN